MIFSRQLRRAAVAVSAMSAAVTAQTFSSCNPLYQSGCPINTALGMAINVDFTRGEVNSFVPSGGAPTYSKEGVSFTVAKPGDAPQLTSIFYIMFGRVEMTMKVAPGKGIVSSLVLQSDDLDEIDIEWLGADGNEMQTNYFGKGKTGSYNRGQFNPAANNQNQFLTYIIDWTADRIQWSVGGTVVRTLSYNEANGEYPQTPMQVKFGSWSGGDSSNAPGTIGWAKGPTDYSQGPFSMIAKSIVVTDYSTGKQYKYGDQSGSWQSIQAVDGKVNGNLGRGGSPTVTATAAAGTSLSPSMPAGGIGKGSSTSVTRTGWPWDASATNGGNTIPDGWVMTSSGKVMPSSSTAELPSLSSSFLAPSSSPAGSAGEQPSQTITTYDGRGFLTTMTVPKDWTRTYNEQGFASVPVQTAPPKDGNSAPKLSEGDAAANGFAASSGTRSSPRWWSGWAPGVALILALCIWIA